MSTPNGQHSVDTNGASSEATSTVLALDGWGPVIPEQAPNGSNGSEPDLVVVEEALAMTPQEPSGDWRQSIRAGLKQQVAKPTIDPQVIKVLAPVATMALAIIVALRLGSSWRRAQVPEAAPTPPSRVIELRRRIALTIDPSLEPVEPQRFAILRRFGY